MPGLGRRWLFLVDTPDLDLMVQRFAPRKDAIWRAGLELGFLHLGIWALSRLVAARVLPSLLPLAKLLRAIADWFRTVGSGRGGMTVTAEGIDRDGDAVTAVWSVVADERDGPNIPILPALAVLRGAITFLLDLRAGPDGLDMIVRGGRLGWLPLPGRLLPRSHATERLDEEGRFRFDLPVSLPGVGALIHYRGWLVPEKSSDLSHQPCRRPPT
jgi:Domain of unknown function (DUF4166)